MVYECDVWELCVCVVNLIMYFCVWVIGFVVFLLCLWEVYDSYVLLVVELW